MTVKVLGFNNLGRLFSTEWGRAVTEGTLGSAVMFSVSSTFVLRNIFRMRRMARAGTTPRQRTLYVCRNKLGTEV